MLSTLTDQCNNTFRITVLNSLPSFLLNPYILLKLIINWTINEYNKSHNFGYPNAEGMNLWTQFSKDILCSKIPWKLEKFLKEEKKVYTLAILCFGYMQWILAHLASNLYNYKFFVQFFSCYYDIWSATGK